MLYGAGILLQNERLPRVLRDALRVRYQRLLWNQNVRRGRSRSRHHHLKALLRERGLVLLLLYWLQGQLRLRLGLLLRLRWGFSLWGIWNLRRLWARRKRSFGSGLPRGLQYFIWQLNFRLIYLWFFNNLLGNCLSYLELLLLLLRWEFLIIILRLLQYW